MVNGRAGGSRVFDPRHLDRIYNVPAVRLQRARTRQLLDARPGDRVLDLGCGAGHLTTELAVDVAPGGMVVGLDQQASMLAGATARAAEDEVADYCTFAVADASSLPLRDSACERLAAVQVFEYVPDVAGALAEVHRVLTVGGRAVLVDTDWRSCVWHTDDRERTDAVLQAWESHFLHPHLPTQLPGLAQSVGFATVEVHALPIVETLKQTDMYSLGMAATIERFVERRAPGLAAGWREDVRSQVRRGNYFFSLTRFGVVLTR